MKEEKSLVTMVLYNIFFKQGMENQVLNCAQMLAAYLIVSLVIMLLWVTTLYSCAVCRTVHKILVKDWPIFERKFSFLPCMTIYS